MWTKFWGTRGSIPTPGDRTRRYGGNTPCVEVRVGGHILIIDAGSGIRELGLALNQEFRGQSFEAHIFISHTHWDHIQGLPFFGPAYAPGNRFTIYGCRGRNRRFADIISGQMSPEYFPVSLEELRAEIRVVELEDEVSLPGATITTHHLNHPLPTLGFRIEGEGATLIYASDNELERQVGGSEGERSLEAVHFSDGLLRFVSQADLFIADAQYRPEQFPLKRGWGHSCVLDAAALAVKAEVRRFALFHHDPEHADPVVDEMVNECVAQFTRWGKEVICVGAREGDAWDLSG